MRDAAEVGQREPIAVVQTDADVSADLQRRFEAAASRTLSEMTAYNAWPVFR